MRRFPEPEKQAEGQQKNSEQNYRKEFKSRPSDLPNPPLAAFVKVDDSHHCLQLMADDGELAAREARRGPLRVGASPYSPSQPDWMRQRLTTQKVASGTIRLKVEVGGML